MKNCVRLYLLMLLFVIGFSVLCADDKKIAIIHVEGKNVSESLINEVVELIIDNIDSNLVILRKKNVSKTIQQLYEAIEKKRGYTQNIYSKFKKNEYRLCYIWIYRIQDE